MTAPETPVFELEVIAMDVAFEIRVSDLPVLRMPAGRVQTTFDVNPYVESGENTLSLLARPRVRGRDFSENAACSVTLRRRAHPEAETADTLGILVFSGYGTGAVTGFERTTAPRGAGPVAVERFGTRGTLTFELDTPFGAWGWASADVLSPTEQLRSELLSEVRRVHALLEKRDAAALEAWCAIQAADFQKAYFLPSLEEAYRLLGVRQLLSDASIEVAPFPESALTLELLGGGRLAQLVDDEGKSPLQMRSIDTPAMTGRFNCVFCRTRAGWQIAR